MFTVLIAEKHHIDAIRQTNKLFFEPFLENKELAFCSWDPKGQCLADAVPGLLDVVGRRKEWRAVIVQNNTIKGSKTRNPFDLVDQSGLNALQEPSRQLDREASWEAWEASWKNYYAALSKEKEAVFRSALEQPFQKLTTWLCFRPENYILNEVQDRQNLQDWALEAIGRDERKPSGLLEQLERQQYKYELRLKEQLRREFLAGYFFSVAFPTEVYCVGIRSAENNYFDPEAYWNLRQASEYSAFADRNMYFDKQRFLVFDMLSPAHRNFRSDYIRFLATLLVFSTNPVPGGALQARRLYNLEVQTDDAPLCTLISSFDRKLQATSEVIDSEMEKIRSEIPGKLSDKAAEELFCTPKDVEVLLDSSCNPGKVQVEQDYGLFFDRPENENQKWNRDSGSSRKALAYIARQQSRAVRKSVSQMHLNSEVSDVNISRLTPLQIDDIREYTDNAEDEMVAAIPPDLADITRYNQRLEEASAQVKKQIGRRMTKKTTLILTGVCLGLYLCCFLPFLLFNSETSGAATTAVVLSLVSVGVLGIVMLVCLLVLRNAVLNAVKNYNATAKDIMDDIQAALKKFSRYLSASCNVRRGHSVCNYAQRNVDEYTMSLRIRKRHQEDIRRKRAYLAEQYGDYMGGRSFCDETMSRPYEYDFDQKTEYEYPAPHLAGDCRQIEFISTGNLVSVPSSYITQIVARLEEIYEK